MKPLHVHSVKYAAFITDDETDLPIKIPFTQKSLPKLLVTIALGIYDFLIELGVLQQQT